MFSLGEVTVELCTDLKFQIHENKQTFFVHMTFLTERKNILIFFM